MANRTDYSGYDFARFEPKSEHFESNAARKIIELPPFEETHANPKKPQMELLPKKKKTQQQAKKEMRASSLRAFKILSISMVLLSLLAGLLYSRLRVDEISRDINRTKTQLSAVQSENVRLNMQLDSMISLDKVETIAQNNLGMVKMDNHQIEYIDLSGEDKVVGSGEKSLKKNDDNKIVAKLLEYIKP
ncbi:MAG: hypothetical protein RR552_04610 [Oscillospiraceae bacterium]